MDRYGVDSSVLLRPKCIGVKGLHFSGQDVANVGMFGAQQSGILTASAIQCRQTYFVANETAINQASLIVCVQKFHMKLLDICIFE